MKKIILFLALILLLQASLRLVFISVPLERDEGAYGYIAQQMIAGDVLYKSAIDHKPPLIYFVYAGIIKYFGASIEAIRVSTLFYSLLTTIAVFGVGFLWLGAEWGLLAAFLYALFSGGPIIQGALSNTESFMALPLVLSLFFFLLYDKNGGKSLYLFLAGLFAGIAVLFKQVAILNFVVLLAVVLFGKDKKLNLSQGGIMLSGFFSIPLIFLLYFLYKHNLADAIYCVLTINGEYLRSLPGNLFSRSLFGLDVIRSQMLLENGILWILSICAILFILLKDKTRQNIVILLWAIVPFCAVFLTGRFFGHYFIQFIPALALLSTYAIYKINQNSNIYINIVLVVIVSFFVLNACKYQLPFYYSYTPDEISTQMYGNPEFVISFRVAQELNKSIKLDDKIFVWSAHPEIYFYLNKKSPTRYFNYLAWMKTGDRDREIFEDLVIARPKYIIRGSYSLPFPELFQYIQMNYKVYFKAGDVIVYRKVMSRG